MDKVIPTNNQRKNEVLFNIFIPSLLRVVVNGRKMPLILQTESVGLYDIAGRSPARIGFFEIYLEIRSWNL
jgi:hypothetical protein